MNWQKEAIEDLENYNNLKSSIMSIKIRIAALKENYKTIKSNSFSNERVQGGNNFCGEEKMIENIAQRERLKMALKANTMLVERIEQGLDGLNDDERFVLEELIIKNKKNAIIELSRKLAYEKSKIYSLRNDALKKFTRYMYGISEF